ncbi:hypothetical protein B0H63DRAFT_490295 [Podospora didyma]|uniref:Uncharacterized protein n=1 Tax=Podospora didyma TaxID=330526 RepID=A0AAE0JXW7_9PEZI|nr:hypothetical protein B0H63DRAFT_490295 [Podospora didyma]
MTLLSPRGSHSHSLDSPSISSRQPSIPPPSLPSPSSSYLDQPPIIIQEQARLEYRVTSRYAGLRHSLQLSRAVGALSDTTSKSWLPTGEGRGLRSSKIHRVPVSTSVFRSGRCDTTRQRQAGGRFSGWEDRVGHGETDRAAGCRPFHRQGRPSGWAATDGLTQSKLNPRSTGISDAASTSCSLGAWGPRAYELPASHGVHWSELTMPSRVDCNLSIL